MENELKFEVAGDQDAAIRELPTLLDAELLSPQEQALESEYFDTPDFLLRRNGAALRVRRDGDQIVQTLKSTGEQRAGIFEREEYESELKEAKPDLEALRAAVPKSSPLSHVLKNASLSDQLAPIFRSTVTRKLWTLRPTSGEEIELALDTGVITAAEHARSFCELELELKHGDPRRLGEVGLRLIDKVPLSLSMQSKSDRGYDLLVCDNRSAIKALPIALRKKDTVEEALCKILHNCLAQVHANVPLVATGHSPEGVHQMRVGLRRFRSALDMFEDVVKLPAALEDEVKWIADELGQSRDWYVLAHSTLSQVDAGDDKPDPMAETKAAAAEIAEDRHAKATAAVQSPRYARVALALDHWITTNPWRDTSDDTRKMLKKRIGVLADRVLRQRHRRLVRRGRGLHKLDAHHRHRARIAAKKLRYAVEFFADLFEQKSLKPYRQVLAKLQDDLGWGNDMAVADGLLSHLQQHHRKASDGAGYARGFLAARVADDRDNQRRLWKRFRSTSRPGSPK
ncbi:CYTH and CHAD domain-containing protein (plasmid) [Cupriavidus sp. P-10]|uniref:CYTH and CHAD domain-containing protein n=1 Tax=Cupriavidus sp. P-10 TaxID=2027911 RepID=UPI000E2F0208|nr:CYTH and CHAD domain-containing protein [Cupriavidus sp. P-10]BDB28848.1 CYTH and CHAD domain-containing protein [Cupriavidus sp. P-10]